MGALPGTERTWPRSFAITGGLAAVWVIEAALAARVAAAEAVQWIATRQHVLCLFADTNYYWALARTIRLGSPYEIMLWSDIPHFALRTPGYPLFLAACWTFCGENAFAARLMQALLGAWSVWLVMVLTRRVVTTSETATDSGRAGLSPSVVALTAGAFAALEPYQVANAAFLLSEALFVPLMTAMLASMAAAWPSRGDSASNGRIWPAVCVGIFAGLAVLSRPSWSLAVPLFLGVWVVCSGPGRMGGALRGAAAAAAAAALVMTPWWVLNARVSGRFVPTAIWAGASLYDGLNPRADGASEMSFLGDADVWPLDESAQDVLLRDRAVAFALANPGRTCRLALIKAARFWSPWPHADVVKSPWIAVVSCVVTLPIYGLLAVGLYDRRRDARALVLCAGPLLYFMLIHMVFVSSVRYRTPGMTPAFGLVAVGLSRVRKLLRGG